MLQCLSITLQQHSKFIILILLSVQLRCGCTIHRRLAPLPSSTHHSSYIPIHIPSQPSDWPTPKQSSILLPPNSQDQYAACPMPARHSDTTENSLAHLYCDNSKNGHAGGPVCSFFDCRYWLAIMRFYVARGCLGVGCVGMQAGSSYCVRYCVGCYR